MIEVTLPRGPKELRIRHFKSMAVVPQEDKGMDEQTQILFLADFLGIKYNQVLDFTTKDIRKMVSLAMSALSKMDLTSKIPETITLGGKKFYKADPSKVGIGWHIDFRACNIQKDPVRLACLYYLPEGYNYSDVDANGNITHPIDSRYDLFEAEFPLDLFIRSSDFFLRQSLRSMKRSMVLKIATSKAKKKTSLVLRKINPFSGRHLSKQ